MKRWRGGGGLTGRATAITPLFDIGPDINRILLYIGFNKPVIGDKIKIHKVSMWNPAKADNILIRAVLEYSPDLQTWTDSGRSAEWVIPANGTNGFYRAKLEIDDH